MVNSGIEVKSPIIRTAYHAPEPGAKKFVELEKKKRYCYDCWSNENNESCPSSDGIVKEYLLRWSTSWIWSGFNHL